MNITGVEVKHKVFGSGTVSDLSEDRITVCFSAGEKSFIFPDVFKGYLLLEDKNMQQRVADMILKQEEAVKHQRQKEQAKLERMHRIKNFTVSTNSQAVFQISPGQEVGIYETHTVSTGHYINGHNKGKPRMADRIKPNSACLLTQRPSGKSESERQIIGAFMVKEDFFGEASQDGVIEAHPVYWMKMGTESQLPFWHYFQEKAPPRWGNTVFKYCSTAVMRRILSDMTQALKETEQYESGLALFHYFCKMNGIRSI